jgi:hypothetical protein
MSKLATTYLTYHELHQQFWNNGIGLLDLCMSKPALEKVVIRVIDGDYELAAIHREGNVLVFDLGQPVQ